MPARKFGEGKANPAKRTVQLYLESRFGGQPEFPIRQNDELRAQVVGGGNALLVWRKGVPPAYPVQIPEPDPKELPWPTKEYDPDLADTDDDSVFQFAEVDEEAEKTTENAVTDL